MLDKHVVWYLSVHHNIMCSIDWLMQVAMLLFQSIAGNIMTASPISDLNPLFLAARCQLTVSSKGARYIWLENVKNTDIGRTVCYQYYALLLHIFSVFLTVQEPH